MLHLVKKKIHSIVFKFPSKPKTKSSILYPGIFSILCVCYFKALM